MKTGLLHSGSTSGGPARSQSQQPRESKLPACWVLGAVHAEQSVSLRSVKSVNRSDTKRTTAHRQEASVKFLSAERNRTSMFKCNRKRALTGGSSGARRPRGRAAGQGGPAPARWPQGSTARSARPRRRLPCLRSAGPRFP